MVDALRLTRVEEIPDPELNPPDVGPDLQEEDTLVPDMGSTEEDVSPDSSVADSAGTDTAKIQGETEEMGGDHRNTFEEGCACGTMQRTTPSSPLALLLIGLAVCLFMCGRTSFRLPRRRC